MVKFLLKIKDRARIRHEIGFFFTRVKKNNRVSLITFCSRGVFPYFLKLRYWIFDFSTFVLCWRGSFETTISNPSFGRQNLVKIVIFRVSPVFLQFKTWVLIVFSQQNMFWVSRKQFRIDLGTFEHVFPTQIMLIFDDFQKRALRARPA